MLSPKHKNGVIDAAARVQNILSALAEEEVKVPNPGQVQDYIARYPDILPILVPVCQSTVKSLDAASQVSLEVYHDPEQQDEYLSLYVRQAVYDANLLDKIDAITRLYEKKLANKNGWLLITTDFQPPR